MEHSTSGSGGNGENAYADDPQGPPAKGPRSRDGRAAGDGDKPSQAPHPRPRAPRAPDPKKVSVADLPTPTQFLGVRQIKGDDNRASQALDASAGEPPPSTPTAPPSGAAIELGYEPETAAESGGAKE